MARKRAYPRACGATLLVLLLTCKHLGLSPRVRGNLSYVTLSYVRENTQIDPKF